MVSDDIIARWLTYSQSSTRQQMMKRLFFFFHSSQSRVFSPCTRPTQRPGLKHPSRQTKQRKEEKKELRAFKRTHLRPTASRSVSSSASSSHLPPSRLACVFVCTGCRFHEWVGVALSACGHRLSPESRPQRVNGKRSKTGEEEESNKRGGN